jgi:hypothetical protein
MSGGGRRPSFLGLWSGRLIVWAAYAYLLLHH